MSGKSPIFPMPEPQHFSDYGFDPQIDYFQVLEEARKHKSGTERSMDALHFRLQKPIPKDESSKKIRKNKRRWWRSALLFFRWKWEWTAAANGDRSSDRESGVQGVPALRASVSGPVYITESRSGSTTPYRTTSRPSSGPLAGTLMPSVKGQVDIPYISLRDLNMDHEHRISTSSMPIYLVT